MFVINPSRGSCEIYIDNFVITMIGSLPEMCEKIRDKVFRKSHYPNYNQLYDVAIVGGEPATAWSDTLKHMGVKHRILKRIGIDILPDVVDAEEYWEEN